MARGLMSFRFRSPIDFVAEEMLPRSLERMNGRKEGGGGGEKEQEVLGSFAETSSTEKSVK